MRIQKMMKIGSIALGTLMLGNISGILILNQSLTHLEELQHNQSEYGTITKFRRKAHSFRGGSFRHSMIQ